MRSKALTNKEGRGRWNWFRWGWTEKKIIRIIVLAMRLYWVSHIVARLMTVKYILQEPQKKCDKTSDAGS